MNINSLPWVNKYNIIMYSTHFNFRSIHNFIYLGLGLYYCYLFVSWIENSLIVNWICSKMYGSTSGASGTYVIQSIHAEMPRRLLRRGYRRECVKCRSRVYNYNIWVLSIDYWVLVMCTRTRTNHLKTCWNAKQFYKHNGCTYIQPFLPYSER